jgi:hypothetical protein
MAHSCSECGATFGSPAELIEHARAEHRPEAPQGLEMNPAAHTPGLECALCGRWFATPQALVAHNLRPHRGVAPRPRPQPRPRPA